MSFHGPTWHVTPRSFLEVGVFVFPSLLVLAPPSSGNGNIKQLMPPYETFTAFWMLSTFLLNWMFANISHGAGGWHDSPSASLRVILPCNTQGKQICIHCMTNLAVCFHWAGVHNIYFSPPFPFAFLSPFPFLSVLTLSLCISSENLSMWYFNVIRNIYQFRLKIHFLLDFFFSWVRRKLKRLWQCWLKSRVEYNRATQGSYDVVHKHTLPAQDWKLLLCRFIIRTNKVTVDHN